MLLLIAAVFCWRRLSHPGLTAIVVAAAAGLGLALFGAWHSLTMRVPLCADAAYRVVDAEIIDGIARTTTAEGREAARFVVRLLRPIQAADCRILASTRVRLSWYDPPPLRIGERWRLTLRLRPAWSYRNAGGFDYERWLFGNRLHGTGYVRSGALQQAVAGPADSGFRHWLDRAGSRHPGIVLALARGDDSDVSGAQWDDLRDSGTVHLLVVSGLHVGLVAGMAYLVSGWLVRLLPLPIGIAPQLLSAVAALLLAGCFVVSTGSGIPAVRAWFMAGVLMLSTSLGWRTSALAVFLLGMAVVLLIDPLAVHQAGFYLSFGAVAVLLYHFSARPLVPGWIGSLLTVQLLLYLFTVPALALQQPTLPAAGALVNLLAVPLLSCILPLLLLSGAAFDLLPGLAGGALAIAELLLDVLLFGIDAAAASGTIRNGAGSIWHLLPALLAAGLSCAALPWRIRLLLLIVWSGWLLPPEPVVPAGEFRVTALDVGQGSAVLIDTRSHRLLFDAGPKYPGGFDLGEVAVLPALLRSGRPRLDALILSHQDIDHTGGAVAVLEQIDADIVYASFPLHRLSAQARVRPEHRVCGRDGSPGWRWDGVDFEFLNLPPRPGDSDNDRSCVLKVSNGSRSALLAGDIGSRMERRLLAAMPELLAADVAFAPHHGSNSSSSGRWVAAVAPRQVLISAPRRSRYGHPHADVLARYKRAGGTVHVTGYSGALTWNSWLPDTVEGLREDRERAYWVSPPPDIVARVRRDG